MVEMENTGHPRARSEIVAMIEHLFSDRGGEWHVSVMDPGRMTTGSLD